MFIDEATAPMKPPTWFGEKFKRDLAAEERRRLERAAMVVEREAKRLLSVSGTGTRGKGGVIKRAVKTAKKKIYGAFPSAPGEPPHKQTGELRRSVAHEVLASVARQIARVGTNRPWGKYLQLGTRFIKPRPWLDVALKNTTGTVKSILGAPWKWSG